MWPMTQQLRRHSMYWMWQKIVLNVCPCLWLFGLAWWHRLWNVAVGWRNTWSSIGLGRTMTDPYFPTELLFELLRMLRNFFFCCFSYGRWRRWAYCRRSVLRSARLPNFAILLFRTRTSRTPGSLMTIVVSDIRTTVLPGANVSHKPRRSLLDRFFTLRTNFRSSDFLDRGIGLLSLGCIINRELIYYVPHYIGVPHPLAPFA